jgi:hypothetical protein
MHGFANREVERRRKTISWRVYDAAKQKLTSKPPHVVWQTVEQLLSVTDVPSSSLSDMQQPLQPAAHKCYASIINGKIFVPLGCV